MTIRQATVDDAAGIAGLIATAFHDLPATAWLIADPVERARVLPANFRIYVDHALAHGEIHLLEDGPDTPVAAAVWFAEPSGPPPADYDVLLKTACGEHTERFRILDELFENNHPQDVPHQFLAFLATRPDQQGRGLGGILLDHRHERLDAEGIPAFLHASSPGSRRLYERHGYELRGPVFHLPGGPPFWPLWRPDRGAGSPPETPVR
ncbi:N-acetyltransferase [Pseudonocardiaceae bacterium YIM PH 21723]|nr:N-acetyltransferase [Pseudonocardiaceae bacterium YIM PH 21723]